jgi:hypothetical protein
MTNSNKVKDQALGMSHGTAGGKLRKNIMYKYVRKAGEHFCYKCGSEIESVDDLSIEHKEPWLYADNPLEMFMDLDNIAFSHLSCNQPHIRRGRVPGPIPTETKPCTLCGISKSISDFWKDPCTPSGLRSRCIQCMKRDRVRMAQLVDATVSKTVR